MSFPNQIGQPQQNVQITQQQLAALLGLLAKQPKADPTSASFDPNYFAQLLAMQNQVSGQQNNLVSQPQQQNIPKQSNSCSYQVVRMVDNPEKIQPQEVVMGYSNLFPSVDEDKIFLKSWNTEGSIETKVYVLEGTTRPPAKSSKKPDEVGKLRTQFSSFSNDILSRLSDLEQSVARLQTKRRQKPKIEDPGTFLTPVQDAQITDNIEEDLAYEQ